MALRMRASREFAGFMDTKTPMIAQDKARGQRCASLDSAVALNLDFERMIFLAVVDMWASKQGAERAARDALVPAISAPSSAFFSTRD